MKALSRNSVEVGEKHEICTTTFGHHRSLVPPLSKSTTEKAIVEKDFYTMRVKIDFFTRYVFMQGVNTRFNVS